MKRLLLVALTTVSVFAGTAATPAQAAATCTTHSLGISAWSEQQGWIDYNASFQCGGGVNTRFRVKITLQEQVGANFIEPGCQAGPCITYRPSATTWYAAGASPSWSGQFNPAASIAGQTFRIRADVIFANGDPTQQWFSNQRKV